MSGITVKKKQRIGDYLFPWVSIISAVSVFFAAQFAAALVMFALKIDSQKYEGAYVMLYNVLAIGGLVAFSFASRFFYSDRNSGVHYKKPEMIKVILVIMIAFGLLGLVHTYMVAATTIADHAKGGVVEHELEKYSEAVDRYSEVEVEEVSKADKIFYYVGVAFVVPLAEELLFRGLILGPLLKKYHGALAVIISAVIFGVMHGISIHIGYAFMSGIIIGCVYCFTRNIAYTYIIHMIFNFFGSIIHMILEDGWFTVSENTMNAIYSYSYLFQFSMIIPCFVALFIFYARYKKQRQLEKKQEESEEKETIEA